MSDRAPIPSAATIAALPGTSRPEVEKRVDACRLLPALALAVVAFVLAPAAELRGQEYCDMINCNYNAGNMRTQCNRLANFPGTVTMISTPTESNVTAILGCWHSYFYQGTMDVQGEFFGRKEVTQMNAVCRFVITTALNGGPFECNIDGPNDGLPVELMEFSVEVEADESET